MDLFVLENLENPSASWLATIDGASERFILKNKWASMLFSILDGRQDIALKIRKVLSDEDNNIALLIGAAVPQIVQELPKVLPSGCPVCRQIFLTFVILSRSEEKRQRAEERLRGLLIKKELQAAEKEKT